MVNIPRSALLTICKSFTRHHHLDYGDILFNKPNNETLQNKIEKLQLKTCLTITGAIQGTSKENLYEELGLHSCIERCWHSKLDFFCNIVNGLLSDYLFSYLNFPSQENYPLRSATPSKIRSNLTRTKLFKKSFFVLLYK